MLKILETNLGNKTWQTLLVIQPSLSAPSIMRIADGLNCVFSAVGMLYFEMMQPGSDTEAISTAAQMQLSTNSTFDISESASIHFWTSNSFKFHYEVPCTLRVTPSSANIKASVFLFFFFTSACYLPWVIIIFFPKLGQREIICLYAWVVFVVTRKCQKRT